MKTKTILILSLIGIMLISIVGCSKSGGSPGGSSGGGSGGGADTSTITFYNECYTPLYLTVNNKNIVLSPLVGDTTFIGKPGDTLTGSAYTYGVSPAGNRVGEQVTWTINAAFPNANGFFPYNFILSTNYFLLQITDVNPNYPITEIIADSGIAGQRDDYEIIPNNGVAYTTGYYYNDITAYPPYISASNVYAINAGEYWYWESNLAYPFNSGGITSLIAQ